MLHSKLLNLLLEYIYNFASFCSIFLNICCFLFVLESKEERTKIADISAILFKQTKKDAKYSRRVANKKEIQNTIFFTSNKLTSTRNQIGKEKWPNYNVIMLVRKTNENHIEFVTNLSAISFIQVANSSAGYLLVHDLQSKTWF